MAGMLRKQRLAWWGLAFLIGLPGSAGATTIDFNALPSGALTNQIPGLTFSSESGASVYVYFFSSGNILCTGIPTITCQDDVYIDFATPVSGLSILAVEPNDFGTVATFWLYNGSTLLGTQNLTGLGTSPGNFGSGNILVDLSAFSNVTRLEIRGPAGIGQLDALGNGIGWDNLTYTASVSNPVPEPSTMLLVGLGLLAVGRRRLLRR
jgi:hypothetical protein